MHVWFALKSWDISYDLSEENVADLVAYIIRSMLIMNDNQTEITVIPNNNDQ